MAVIFLSSPLPLPPCHPMNLPSLPSEVLNIAASYPSWHQHFHAITPPWSSKPHHPTMTTLPPITSLQRQYQYRDTARSSPLFLAFSFIAQTVPQFLLSQPSIHPHNPRSRPLLCLLWTRRALPYPTQPALPGDRSPPHPHQTMYRPNNTSRAGSATLVHTLPSTPRRTLVK